jgi:phage/plasmid-associated DNA primase
MDPSLKHDSKMPAHDDVELVLADSQVAHIAGSHMSAYMTRVNPKSAELNDFFISCGREVKEGKEYNIIDQHLKNKWNVPPNAMPALIDIIEKFRLDGVAHGICQRQHGNARFFLDGDIKLLINKQVTTDHNLYNNLLRIIVPIIMKNTVCDNEKGITELYAHCEARSATTFDRDTACYKDGFHIRFSTMFSQAYRKKTLELLKDGCDMRGMFFGDSDSIKNLDDIIDMNSATVPVLYPGGTKPNGIPYKTVAVYRIQYAHSGNAVRMVMLSEEEVLQINIAMIFGPKYISRDDKKRTITPKVSPSFQHQLNKVDQACFDEMDSEESRDISIMHMNDPQARELSQLLQMLARTRSDDYKTWFKVLTTLARYGQKYKPLARMFSLQSQTKYDESKFEEQWEKCISTCSNYPGCCIGMLHKMARFDDPENYKLLTSSFITETICKSVFEVMSFMDKASASLGDYHIAEIIYTAFPSKYFAVPKRTTGGKRMADDSDVSYYSMIMPGTPEYTKGAAYKYGELMSMAPLNLYISKKIPLILKQVQSYFRSKRDAPSAEEQQIKKYAIALGIIGKVYGACMNHRSKGSIMRQFAYMVTNFQFERELDSATYAIGVYDAILETGVRPRLLQDVTEYKLSRYTMSHYILFDPQEKILVETMQIYLDFVIADEFDVLLFIMIFQCRALSRKQKKVLLLNLWGNGSNGKSTLIKFLYTALGKVQENGYAYHMDMDYLVKERTSSGGAQSELMPLENATYVTMSEPGENEHVIESKWKQLMSGESISARELYGTQRNFVPISVLILGSNNALRFKDGGKNRRRYKYDYGMLRRLAVAKARKEFKSNPDPNNPLHVKANGKIITDIVPSPVYAGALLSIMSIMHALFIMIHKEDFDTVCSPNIEKQTEEHINNFDTIGKFISKNCVVGEKIRVKLSAMIDMYIAWHDREYASVQHSRERIREAFLSSKIEKKIAHEDGEHWCNGIRAIAIGEQPGDGETRYEKDDKYEFKAYEDFKMESGRMLPLNGEIKRTTDARDFLAQLDAVHKKHMLKWDEDYGPDVNYIESH